MARANQSILWPAVWPGGLCRPAHNLLTSQLAAPRARPFDHIHEKVGLAQLGNEVGRDDFPRAGSDIPDHAVVSTILHTRKVTLVGHHRASRVGRLRTWRSVP